VATLAFYRFVLSSSCLFLAVSSSLQCRHRVTANGLHLRRFARLGQMDADAMCVPRMGIEEDQSAAIGTKIAKSWKTFYSWEMKVLLTLK